MDELARGEREEKPEHETKMNAEKKAHDAGCSENQKHKTRQADQEKQSGERHVHPHGTLVIGTVIHARLQPEQTARTYAQGDAAERAYEGRQTEEAVRSRPAEAMIIDEGDAGRERHPKKP